MSKRAGLRLSFEALRRALWIDESFEISAVRVNTLTEEITVILQGEGLPEKRPSEEIMCFPLERFQRVL